MFQQNKSTEELQALVRALAWNDAFGCYTRNGFEKMVWPEIARRAKWIIYFDLDNIHALNDQHGGYEWVDEMVRTVFSKTRLTDHIAVQFKSGDEFLICVTEDSAESSWRRKSIAPQQMVDRLADELGKQGMSATFAIVPVVSTDLLTNVEPAIEQVYAQKKSRPQGCGR